jgi:hypothetical protein
MATLLSAIETNARIHLIEPTPAFWTSAELVTHMNSGIKDLWRDIVDLKAEHFLTRDNTNVSLPSGTDTLLGVPADVHKVYMIEPRDVSNTSANVGVLFQSLDYNHPRFQSARTVPNVDPSNVTFYFCITGKGGPITAPTIYVAPKSTGAMNLSFTYVPTIGTFASTDTNPIPGESDNALMAWTVAFARAKEREDRSPDPNWLAVYSTEKTHLLESLGLRQYQDLEFSDATYEEYWG